MPSPLAVTWWGHSSMSLELGGRVVATDPALTGRVQFVLRRHGALPPPEAAHADVVVISHLHYDHLHLPSLRRFAADVPLVVPRGTARAVPSLARRHLVEVVPGDEVEVAGITIRVLPAHHDGRRHDLSRVRDAPAIGFRISHGDHAVWYPGDTGARDDFAGIGPVDLACVPIGGWGPSLGEHHLDPAEAAAAVARVGATWALAVHYGTYWPMLLDRLAPGRHQHLFHGPPGRFRDAMAAMAGASGTPLTPAPGDRVVLSPSAG